MTKGNIVMSLELGPQVTISTQFLYNKVPFFKKSYRSIICSFLVIKKLRDIKHTQIQFSDRTIHGLQQAGWAGWAGAVPRDVWECGAGMYCPWSMNIFLSIYHSQLWS